MSRQMLGSLIGVLLLIAAALPAGAFQEATPESELAGLGLPELDITVTTTAIEGVPEQLEAGRYLVRVSAADDTEFGGVVGFVQPVGVTVDEFLEFVAAFAGPPDEVDAEMAVEGTPVEADEEMGGLPPWIISTIFAGGAFAPPGESAEVVLDLGPGEWIAWPDDPEAPQSPVVFEVTGEMPAEPTEPAATATLTTGEYFINVSEGELRAGRQVVKVENIGAQPHFIFVAKGPGDMTEEQIAAVLEAELAAEESGTPPAYGDLNPEEDLEDVGYTVTQSMGTAQWVELDLEPGTYALICFFPDFESGLPHAFEGMYSVVQVAE